MRSSQIDYIVLRYLESLFRLLPSSGSLDDMPRLPRKDNGSRIAAMVSLRDANPMRYCTAKQKAVYMMRLTGRTDDSIYTTSSTGHTLCTGKKARPLTRDETAKACGLTARAYDAMLSAARASCARAIVDG